MPFADRHRVLNGVRQRLSVDALLLTDPSDVRWACGFTGSSGWLYWSPWEAFLLTDGRYTIQAAREVTGAEIRSEGGDLAAQLAEVVARQGARVAFSSDQVTVEISRRLSETLPQIRWIPATRLLARERAVKVGIEVEAITRAQRITEHVFDELLGVLRPGFTEREIAAEIVYRQLKRGAERMSFDPIVASGAHSALPHARPSGRVIERGDLLLLDFGCVVDGYASDMTRMVSIGSPEPEVRAVYDVVRGALDDASGGARSGMGADELDLIARSAIERAGYGPAFSHSLGHGVGLDIHEWPGVSFRNPEPLPDGAVITLEPGIYLEGRFGIRVEDLVVLKPDGIEVITRLSRDLFVV